MSTTKQFSCDPKRPVTISFFDKCKVTLRGEHNDQEAMTVTFPNCPDQRLRYSSGLIGLSSNSILLTARRAQNSTILESSSMGRIRVNYTEGDSEKSAELSDVKRLIVRPDSITAVCNSPVGGSGGNGGNGGSGVRRPPAPGQTIDIQVYNRLKQEHDRCRKLLADTIEEHKTLRTKYNTLVTDTAQGLDQLISNANTSQLPAELQTRLATLQQARQALAQQQQTADQQLQEAEAANEAARQKLEETQTQIAALRSQEEITSLDCREAEKELESIRVRLQLDGDVVELTDDRWLKNNSVTDTLKELEKSITAVEKRITWIVRKREFFGNSVQNAVLLDGDGCISGEDERGGPRDSRN